MPVPPKSAGTDTTTLLGKLAVGESVLLPMARRQGVYSCAKNLKIKVTARSEGDHIRVWRTE